MELAANDTSIDAIAIPTALYRHRNAEGTLLYVGISLSPIYRLSQHRDASPWFKEIATVTVEWFDSRELALAAEREAIRSESPIYNIVHRVTAREAYLAEMAEESCAELTRKVTRFQPSYSISTAASTIGITEGALRLALAAGDIPYFPGGAKAVSITGWAVIAYLEALQSGAAKIRPNRKLSDGRSLPPPTAEWLAENHGHTSIDAWTETVTSRWAARDAEAA